MTESKRLGGNDPSTDQEHLLGNELSTAKYGTVAIATGTMKLKREVGLTGGVSLIVGSIIGSGIFISPKGVLEMTGSVGLSLVVWAGSGILTLLGALCYSELGTTVTRSGGEYAYLLEAFGPLPAFLFAWTSVLIIKPSSIAIICLTFAEYTAEFFPYCGTADAPTKVVAVTAVFTLMVLNCLSVSLANKAQIFFTFAKLIALGIIIVGGMVRLAQGHTIEFQNSFDGTVNSPSTIALAFYQALWAFDGWNNLNFITEEIDQPEKNLPRANVLGVLLVTVVYVLTNVAYLTALSAAELLASSAVAVTWGDRVLGSAAIILPLAVLFSTFGSANGTVFAGGRVVYVAAREGHLPELLSYIQVNRLTPLPSVVFTCIITAIMVNISNISGLVDFFSFTAWVFYGLAVTSLLVMRYTKPEMKRIIKLPVVIPIFFVLCALYLVIAPIVQDPKIEFLYAALFVVGGLVFYVPFVHFKVINIDSFTIWCQLLLELAPSRYEKDA